MAYNPFDPSSRYRLPSWNLDNPLGTQQSGLGGAISSQTPGVASATPTGAYGDLYNPDQWAQFQGGRTPPRTTTPPATPTGPLPGLPGDTATGGSVNPATGLWSESAAPSPTAASPTGLAPRDSRYAASQAAIGTGTSGGLGRATALQSVMGSAPTPGGPTAPYGSLGNNPASFASGYPPTGPGTSPSVDARMTRLDEGLTLPKQSITPEDVMVDPGFKWQQEQLGRRLEDIFAAKGRVGSTDYFNTLTNANQKLISDEYNRINNQQWERGMEMNRLLYDRRAQENITNYEREFRENERKYGREQAENILAYERSFREDARDYERLRYLVQLGFGATQASTGT